MSTHTLSVLVENKPGVLAHVAETLTRSPHGFTDRCFLGR